VKIAVGERVGVRVGAGVRVRVVVGVAVMVAVGDRVGVPVDVVVGEGVTGVAVKVGLGLRAFKIEAVAVLTGCPKANVRVAILGARSTSFVSVSFMMLYRIARFSGGTAVICSSRL
jgi:hypothetical protein